MKACVLSNGCLDNHYDELTIKSFLLKNGWDLCDKYENADLIIINTCAFRKDKESDSLFKIQCIQATKKPQAQLIVGGCLAAVNRELLQKYFNGPTFTPATLHHLNDLVKPSTFKIGSLNAEDITLVKSLSPSEKEVSYQKAAAHSPEDLYFTTYKKQYFRDYLNAVFPVKIGSGCLGDCSYCSEKAAKGALKSKPFNEVSAEFKAGLKKGFAKFVLIADDVGAYGQDLPGDDNIATLLDRLIKIKGDFKISIRHANPEWLLKYRQPLEKILSSGKISTIMVPVQSGSDKILKAMSRKYRAGAIRDFLLKIRKRAPNLKVFTHVLVGFPGETNKDFNATLAFLKDVKFNFVYVYIFQKRPDTPAAASRLQIPEKIKNSRFLEACLVSLQILSSSNFDF